MLIDPFLAGSPTPCAADRTAARAAQPGAWRAAGAARRRTVAETMKVKALSRDELLDPLPGIDRKTGDALFDATPLWYYVLCEARASRYHGVRLGDRSGAASSRRSWRACSRAIRSRFCTSATRPGSPRYPEPTARFHDGRSRALHAGRRLSAARAQAGLRGRIAVAVPEPGDPRFLDALSPESFTAALWLVRTVPAGGRGYRVVCTLRPPSQWPCARAFIRPSSTSRAGTSTRCARSAARGASPSAPRSSTSARRATPCSS